MYVAIYFINWYILNFIIYIQILITCQILSTYWWRNKVITLAINLKDSKFIHNYPMVRVSLSMAQTMSFFLTNMEDFTINTEIITTKTENLKIHHLMTKKRTFKSAIMMMILMKTSSKRSMDNPLYIPMTKTMIIIHPLLKLNILSRLKKI